MPFKNPLKILNQYWDIVRYIEAVPCGGDGSFKKEEVLHSHKRWLNTIQHYTDNPKRLRECLKAIYGVRMFDYMPSDYIVAVKNDIGFRTLLLIMLGYKKFYLCDDCRAPLISFDSGDGCPVCGDCFNRRTVYAIKLNQ